MKLDDVKDRIMRHPPFWRVGDHLWASHPEHDCTGAVLADKFCTRCGAPEHLTPSGFDHRTGDRLYRSYCPACQEQKERQERGDRRVNVLVLVLVLVTLLGGFALSIWQLVFRQ